LYNGLYNALVAAKKDAEAFEALAKARVLGGAPDTTIAEMRAAFERGGLVELARLDLAALLEADRTRTAPPSYYSRLSLAASIARQYATIGDGPHALDWLEEGVKRRDDGPLTIRTAPYWPPFKNDPRFKAVERLVAMP
jgi:hypothetical protein